MRNNKKRFLSTLLIICLLFSITALEPSNIANSETIVTVKVTGIYGQSEAREMLEMVNDLRTGRLLDGGQSQVWALDENGEVDTESYADLQELEYDYTLEQIAMERAMETILRMNHYRPNGEYFDTIVVDGYSSQGENLVAGYNGKGSTAKQAFDGLREEDKDYSGQDHRRNMLRREATCMGAAHVMVTFTYNTPDSDTVYTREAHYWVQEFGSEHGPNGETEVAPCDEEVTKDVEILKEYINSAEMTATIDTVNMLDSEEKDLEGISTRINTFEMWPPNPTIVTMLEDEEIDRTELLHGYEVKEDYILSSRDETVATCDGTKIIGQGPGNTTIDVESNFADVEPLTIDVNVSGDISKAIVQGVKESYEVTGEEITPAPSIRYPVGDSYIDLTEGEDYSLSYSDNKEIGTATITISGINQYTGSLDYTFEITHIHELEKVESKDPFCEEEGNIEYYKCKLCHRKFLDSEKETLLEEGEEVLPALGHDFTTWEKYNENQHYHVCKRDIKHIELGEHTWGEEGRIIKEATVTEEGIIEYKCTECDATKEGLIPKLKWERLYGNLRYDTMQKIVERGFDQKNGIVIVAKGNNFPDALAAAGLAGVFNSPIVLTDEKNLSPQAKTVLQKLEPSYIIIAGGPSAIKRKVDGQIQEATGVMPSRAYGPSASDTSAALAKTGKGRWSKDKIAVIATSKTFEDALSVAPICYAKEYPLLLADNGEKLSDTVLGTLEELGIQKVIIVGGPSAIKTKVEEQLTEKNIEIMERLWGPTALNTSLEIAKWGINNGMNVNNMGFATDYGFADALTGAALCGKLNSVLLLAGDNDTENTSFPSEYKDVIEHGFIFGGPNVIKDHTYEQIVASTE